MPAEAFRVEKSLLHTAVCPGAWDQGMRERADLERILNGKGAGGGPLGSWCGGASALCLEEVLWEAERIAAQTDLLPITCVCIPADAFLGTWRGARTSPLGGRGRLARWGV